MDLLYNNPSNELENPLPAETECPIDYERHKLACYQFSSHSSYDDAKKACESTGARLADIESTHGKFVIDRVRSMGGNDFWIGSFRDRGKVYRQKGRTSCPIMRGQVTDNTAYGLVNCNSANRFVCQKYGPDNKGRNLNLRTKAATALTPTKTTTELSQDADGTSTALYIVITVLVVIAALVALKFLRSRYLRKKKKSKKSSKSNGGKTTNNTNSKTNGIVFTPKRKTGDSKRTSIDSAVPPSNVSYTSEKHLPTALYPNDVNENVRMSRPRVNGPRPTRKPPGISENYAVDTCIRTDERTPRRHHSDPRSNNGDISRARQQLQCYYSEYSDTMSSSETDGDTSHTGPTYGPQKVYERQSSRAPMSRDHYRQEMRRNFYSPSRRARPRSGHDFINDVTQYHDDFDGDCQCDVESESDTYRRGNRRFYGDRNRVSTITGNLANHRVDAYGRAEMQYFPEPHRLVSWNNLAELNDFSFQATRPADEPPKSFPREPIRVRRKIHQRRVSVPKMRTLTASDEQHVYESLEKAKKRKAKKASKKKCRQAHEERRMKRTTGSRGSVRSVASIQSRKLPTPPLL